MLVVRTRAQIGTSSTEQKAALACCNVVLDRIVQWELQGPISSSFVHFEEHLSEVEVGTVAVDSRYDS